MLLSIGDSSAFMPIVALGDLEFNPGDLVKPDKGLSTLDQYLKGIDSFLDKHYDADIYKTPLVGRLFRKVYDLVDAPLFLMAGDYISKGSQSAAVKSACDLYTKLSTSDALDDKLRNYKSRSGLKFTDESMGRDIATLYADILFTEDLVDDPVSGIYSKIFTRINGFARHWGVKFGFVLGNNDLGSELFESRFNKLMRFKGLSKVKFVNNEVRNISGYSVAGFNGSAEFSKILSYGTSFISLSKGSDEVKEKAVDEYTSLVSCTSGFKEASKKFRTRKGVDALLVHKAYNSINGKVKWGRIPQLSPVSEEFMPVIDSLIKKLKPLHVVSGHSHGSVCVEKDGIWYMNGGIRGVARNHLYKNGEEPEQLIGPNGELSEEEMKNIENDLNKSFNTTYSNVISSRLKSELDGLLSDEAGLASKLKTASLDAFPNLEAMRKTKYASGMTVLDHTLKLYDYLEGNDDYKRLDSSSKRLLNLSVLLHDVVKKGSRTAQPNHEVDCANAAKQLLTGWGYDELTINSVAALVRYHSALGSIATGGVKYKLNGLASVFNGVDPALAKDLVELLRLLNKADMASVSGGSDGNLTPVPGGLTKGAAVDKVAQELVNVVNTTSSTLTPGLTV